MENYSLYKKLFESLLQKTKRNDIHCNIMHNKYYINSVDKYVFVWKYENQGKNYASFKVQSATFEKEIIIEYGNYLYDELTNLINSAINNQLFNETFTKCGYLEEEKLIEELCNI